MPTGRASHPIGVRSVLPALGGQGVLLAAAADADRIRHALADAGFAIVEADLSARDQRADPTTLRTAQATIAEALYLPETAGRNLDAMVDSLRDLATWWPEDERILLLLHGAEALVQSDLPGWHTLTEILRDASRDLWQGGAPGDRVFETVALVDRHGVPSLPTEPLANAVPDGPDLEDGA